MWKSSTFAAPARGRWVIAVDTDGGVSLDDIADSPGHLRGARRLRCQRGGAVHLEVTSWVHRPLTLPRHWRRNQGRLVKITTSDGATFEGRIADSDDEGAQIDVADREPWTTRGGEGRRAGRVPEGGRLMDIDMTALKPWWSIWA